MHKVLQEVISIGSQIGKYFSLSIRDIEKQLESKGPPGKPEQQYGMYISLRRQLITCEFFLRHLFPGSTITASKQLTSPSPQPFYFLKVHNLLSILHLLLQVASTIASSQLYQWRYSYPFLLSFCPISCSGSVFVLSWNLWTRKCWLATVLERQRQSREAYGARLVWQKYEVI